MQPQRGETKRAVVLGGGMVGGVMAADLARDEAFGVAIADISESSLARVKAIAPNVSTVQCDLSKPPNVRDLVGDFDIVLGALSSTLGFEALRAVIEAERDYCDICFMPEDALALHDLARERGVTAVVDNGVAPGMSNMLVGYASTQLDEIEHVKIYVGGLPVERRWPFEYKAGFAPYDVIEEYTRPARFIENGSLIEKDALTDSEYVDFEHAGTLEAVNTDGLRSLIHTINARNMIEKTLRYPGHYELMRVLRHMGLFDHEPVEVGRERTPIPPIDVTSALLFPQWKYEPGERDLTVMRVIVEGIRDGERVTHEWNLYDEMDQTTGFTSMSRTTAFPNAIVARMVASGAIRKPGVNPPELLGRMPDILDDVLRELEARNVVFHATTKIS